MRNFKLTHVGFIIAAFALSACNDSNDETVMPMVNNAPTATDAMVTTQTEVVVSDRLMASDSDGDSLNYSLVTDAMLGMVVVNVDGSYTYTPNPETTGSDSFEFAVSDGVNPQVTATVSIIIEELVVDFATAGREAYGQEPTDTPLSVNGKVFINSGSEANFDDLLIAN
ncbi:Ig-like domain-containing protein [Alteromonadaceae bacterium BrNp21-10]|nr:Ig-like domain-containing protein [Alteromonadaceae bacterium BrNp21-10]